MKKSVLKKYLVWLLPILLVVFFIIGYGSEMILRQEILADSRSLGNTTTGNIASAMSLWLEDQILIARGIADDKRIIQACLDPANPEAYIEAKEFLESMHGIHTYYENMPVSSFTTGEDTITVVYNGEEKKVPPGGFIIDTVKGKTIGKGAAKNYISAIRKGSKVFISEVYPSILRGNPIFVIAVPVTHEGKIIGAAIIAPQMDYFTKVFTQQPFLRKAEHVFVGDTSGKIIAHNNTSLILKKEGDEYFQPLLDFVNKGTMEFVAEINGKKTLLIAKTHKMGTIDHVNEWLIFYSLELSSITDRLVSLRTIIIFAVLLMMVVLSAVIIIATRRLITNPIRTITDGAECMSVGDIKLTGMDRTELVTISKRTDEIGNIGKSFIKLTEYQTEKVKVAEEIANKNLAVTTSISSEKDLLGQTFQKMVSSLNDIVGSLLLATGQVDAGSKQVSDSSQSLSQGATEQASSLEEIGSSMAEINNQTRTNAENAAQANQLVKSVNDSTVDGTKQMQSMISAMDGISKSSNEIGKIIKVIDDIAFQTNLLALNAAVEAARAGKHGKGFAVVAQEVRSLAARSAKAAQETTNLIEDSVQRVKDGNMVADNTAKVLTEINDGIKRVKDLVEDIAAASNEQASGIAQINQGLSQIDSVTQQNTANAEETSAAAEELSSQAAQVLAMLKQFKLNNTSEGRATDRGDNLNESAITALSQTEATGQSNKNRAPRKKPELLTR